MLTRNILVVDDDKHTESISIYEYKEIFNELKKIDQLSYSINFKWESSIQKAIERLNDTSEVFDVVVIDYDFSKSDDVVCRKGTELVKEIRKTINNRTKIVFYTMNGIDQFCSDEFVELINNDVYRFVSKSGDNLSLKFKKCGKVADQLIVEAIIDAIKNSDPFSNTLERYLVNYSELMEHISLKVDDNEYSIKDIIKSIRRADEIGNIFVNNLLEISIMDFLEFKWR